MKRPMEKIAEALIDQNRRLIRSLVMNANKYSTLNRKNRQLRKVMRLIEDVLNIYPQFSPKYIDVKYSENCFRDMHARVLGIIKSMRKRR